MSGLRPEGDALALAPAPDLPPLAKDTTATVTAASGPQPRLSSSHAQALRNAEFLARSQDALLVPVLAWQPPGGDRAAQVQPASGLVHAWRELAWQQLQDALGAV